MSRVYSTYVASGAMDSSTQRGRLVLGHELAHVAQQYRSGALARQAKDGGGSGPDNARLRDASLEAEADRIGALAAQGHSVAGMTRGRVSRPGAQFRQRSTSLDQEIRLGAAL